MSVYKEDNLNSIFLKQQVLMCVRGDHQKGNEFFFASVLYATGIKALEAQPLAAIAAGHSCPILKTDMR
jgi:hypothetical protein